LKLRFIDPIISWEVNKTLRDKRAALLLILYCAFLGGMIYLTWPRGEKMAMDRALISRNLFSLFSLTQLIAIAIVAPVYAASSFTIEKERGCFDFLVMTPISASRLVSGKLLGAVTFLLLLASASFPMAAACLLLGGISFIEVVNLYVILVCCAFLFAAVGVSTSIRMHRTYMALSVNYLVTIVIMLILLPIIASSMSSAHSLITVSMLLVPFTLVVAYVILLSACGCLDYPPEPEKTGLDDDGSPQEMYNFQLRPNAFPDRYLFPPWKGRYLPNRVNPMMDKELRVEVHGYGSKLVKTVLLFGMAALTILVGFMVYAPALILIFLMTLIAMLGPAFAAGAITQERERGTLELLRATLLPAYRVVWAKTWTPYRLLLIFSAIFAAIPTFIFTIFAAKLPTPLLESLFWIGSITVVNAFLVVVIGFFFSCFFRNTLQSMIGSYAAVAAVFVGPLLLYYFLYSFTDIPTVNMEWIMSFSPFRAALFIGSGSDDMLGFFNQDANFAITRMHLCVVAVLSLFFFMANIFMYRWRVEKHDV
jgi:ABC-type transport system involved in multi-copper enzyme maturation permease subunit